VTAEHSDKTARPDETFWRLEVEIFPGKLREFKAIVHEQIASAE